MQKNLIRLSIPNLTLILLLIFYSQTTFAQVEICGNGFDDNFDGVIDENCYTCTNKQDNLWHFGMGVEVNFNTGTPVVSTNGSTAVREGVATIANSNGELLFYTDGRSIWDRNHNIMQGGNATLGGGVHGSSTHAVVAIPHPGNTS